MIRILKKQREKEVHFKNQIKDIKYYYDLKRKSLFTNIKNNQEAIVQSYKMIDDALNNGNLVSKNQNKSQNLHKSMDKS